MFVNSNQILIMASVIIASVFMASVTIMASVTYGKCNLWQVLLMANETEPLPLIESKNLHRGRLT